MTVPRSTRRVYSAEELHQLRSTVSQPKLHEAIKEHDAEDAELVKDHVLRGSKSFAARSWRSRISHKSNHSLRASSNKENRSTNASDNDQISTSAAAPGVSLAAKAVPVLGEIAPNNQTVRPIQFRLRTSPTPSLRRKQIESLVKAHGSPTHVRVTAGGRIVPKEQSPLCHPRFGYSAIKTNGGLIKLAQNHPIGKAQWTQATQNGFVAQDVDGRLCQIVDGTILPLTEVDGALQLFMPAPNLNITQRATSQGAIPDRPGPNGIQDRQATRVVPPEPSTSAQINALELEYIKLNHELKDLDKTEVLHGRTMGKAAKDVLVTKRRELVLTLDRVRKALKSLKEQVPAKVAPPQPMMQNKQHVSPPRSRLPAFLQQKQQMNAQDVPLRSAPPFVYGGFLPPPAAQAPLTAAYGFREPPSPPSSFAGQPWAMPPAAIFIPPPPFDGSFSSLSLPCPEPLTQAAVNEHTARAASDPAVALPTAEPHLSQTDGARSCADLQKVISPYRSHALPIKAPEHKGQGGVRSNLNPMSPAYKPGTGSLVSQENDVPRSVASGRAIAPARVSSVHHSSPGGAAVPRVMNTTGENISPVEKKGRLASSSVASFETADFFPRNTREYSTRRHAYPTIANSTEDKESLDSQRRDSRLSGTSVSSANQPYLASSGPANTMVRRPSGANAVVPVVPPGTPASPQPTTTAGTLPSNLGSGAKDDLSSCTDTRSIPDRVTHNLSPKSKLREWLFIEEDPARYLHEASSSPEKFHSYQDELCVTSSPYDSIDFSDKSREWVEGYQAGLGRKAVGADRNGDFLDGYCSGLLKTKPPASLAPSTGSPVKSASRHSSAAPSRAVSGSQQDRHGTTAKRPAKPPLMLNPLLMDSLKQAALAPQNENAILTPAADGPHINEAQYNLGGWARGHADGAASENSTTASGATFGAFQFPPRTSSMLHRQAPRFSEGRVGPKDEPLSERGYGALMRKESQAPPLEGELSHNNLPLLPSSPMSCAKSLASSDIITVNNTNRISSMTSVDSNLYRQYPGHRVFSPHLEWKSASSVAHQAGLANGFFAHAQLDGTIEPMPFTHRPITHAHPIPGPHPRPSQPGPSTSHEPATYYHGRFREGSLDGITDPPMSPPPAILRAATSPPPTSLTTSPGTSPTRGRDKESPAKSNSPARAKFEHIAERVGIKASIATPAVEASSPPSKRRWRDVWRGNRKDSCRDEPV